MIDLTCQQDCKDQVISVFSDLMYVGGVGLVAIGLLLAIGVTCVAIRNIKTRALIKAYGEDK